MVVDVVEGAPLFANMHRGSPREFPKSNTLWAARRHRPVFSGAGIGIEQTDTQISAGTFGCCVVRNSDRTHWGLTCEHVRDVNSIDPPLVRQPPLSDDVVGQLSAVLCRRKGHFQRTESLKVSSQDTLEASENLRNERDEWKYCCVDAALIAPVTQGMFQTGLHPDIDWSWETSLPAGLQVNLTAKTSRQYLEEKFVNSGDIKPIYKLGQKTGMTKGACRNIAVAQYLAEEGTQDQGQARQIPLTNHRCVWVSECLLVTPYYETLPFSGKGDSGAVAFTLDAATGQGSIVGLVFAGCSYVSCVSFIDDVERVLDVQVCFENHQPPPKTFLQRIGGIVRGFLEQ